MSNFLEGNFRFQTTKQISDHHRSQIATGFEGCEGRLGLFITKKHKIDRCLWDVRVASLRTLTIDQENDGFNRD